LRLSVWSLFEATVPAIQPKAETSVNNDIIYVQCRGIEYSDPERYTDIYATCNFEYIEEYCAWPHRKYYERLEKEIEDHRK